MATFWPEGLCSAELETSGAIVHRYWKNIPHNTVSALSNYILDIILIRYIERDLPRAAGLALNHVGGILIYSVKIGWPNVAVPLSATDRGTEVVLMDLGQCGDKVSLSART